MRNLSLLLAMVLCGQSLWALPVDWSGTFGMDTTFIDNYPVYTRQQPDAGGSQEASFQTYRLKLQPTIIINDAVSLFGEITTGYASGSLLGRGWEQTQPISQQYIAPDPNSDDTTNSNTKPDACATGCNIGNALYYYSAYRETLHLSQVYAKYYADTATYIIGRWPLHWGLGAIFSDGSKSGERFASVEDGIMAHFAIGDFRFSPYYTKANGGVLDGDHNLESSGIQMMYRNSEQEFSFGVLFGKRENSNKFELLKNGKGQPLKAAAIKTIDFYLQKTIKKLNLALEIPIMQGNLGRAYADGSKNSPNEIVDYNARGFVGRASYTHSSAWDFQLDAGYLSGNTGDENSDFKALYLHPNYHIAHLMFRYNLYAVEDSYQESLFDSYMTNATYAKLLTTYHVDKWSFNLGLIWANALETTEANSSAFFDHETNRRITKGSEPFESQGQGYGFEVDLDFDYQWNSNISIQGLLGYHFVGDYYQFDQSRDPQDSYIMQLQTLVHF